MLLVADTASPASARLGRTAEAAEIALAAAARPTALRAYLFQPYCQRCNCRLEWMEKACVFLGCCCAAKTCFCLGLRAAARP